MKDAIASPTAMEKIALRSDNGAIFQFSGRIFSESSYYDEELNQLTRLRLFLSDDGCQIYSFVANSATQKSRRFYTIKVLGELCEMSDGIQSMVLPIELLFASVFGMLGIDPTRAEDLRSTFEESLKIASAG